MKLYRLILGVTFFIYASCNIKEKRDKFISNFNNDVYLALKNYIDTSSVNFISGSNDSFALNVIRSLYDKRKLPFLNDTTILQAYQSWFGGSEDYFCGAYEYYMKRRIRVYTDENEKADTLKIGILSANIEESLPSFIAYIDSCLKSGYFKVIKSPEEIPVHLDIKLASCRIGSIVITANEKVDKDLINELYKIIYTSPKWQLDEVEATKEEKENHSYERPKHLSINVNINNIKTEIASYTVDSIASN